MILLLIYELLEEGQVNDEFLAAKPNAMNPNHKEASIKMSLTTNAVQVLWVENLQNGSLILILTLY